MQLLVVVLVAGRTSVSFPKVFMIFEKFINPLLFDLASNIVLCEFDRGLRGVLSVFAR